MRDYPKTWYSRKAIINSDMSDEDKELYLNIVADRKPYFQQYIYPSLRKEYLSYIANTKRKSLRLFRKDVEELKSTPKDSLSEDERKFLQDFEVYCPVIDAGDTINRICHYVENEFKSYVVKQKETFDFDYSILKTEETYTDHQYREIKKIYAEYTERLKEYNKSIKSKRVDTFEANGARFIMRNEFKKRCENVCSNSEILCNIIIDMTYEKEGGRQFTWDVCGEQIIENLLKNNDYKINVPVLDDENGNVEFRGHKYRLETVDYPREDSQTEEVKYEE